MKIPASTKLRYIPEFNGNRELPADEQIGVDIQLPTLAERDYYNSFAAKENVFLKSYVSKFVTKIDNLTEVRDGSEVKISNGEELVKSTAGPLWPLALELCAQVVRLERLEDADRKK